MLDKIILFFINLYFGGPWRTYEDEHGVYDIDTHLIYEYYVDAPVEEKKVYFKRNVDNPVLYEVERFDRLEPVIIKVDVPVVKPEVQKEKSFIVRDTIGRYANDQNFGEEWELEMGSDFCSFTRENDLFYSKKDPDHHFKLVKTRVDMWSCICTFSYVNTRNSMSHIIKPGDKIYRVN